MSAVLTTLGTVVTTLISSAGDIVTFIMAEGHELCLIPFGVILAYDGVALIKRIL